MPSVRTGHNESRRLPSPQTRSWSFVALLTGPSFVSSVVAVNVVWNIIVSASYE